ncbi:MAG: hypothetical protein JJU29_08335 [Verrucomicrobia bacterium]|nr:hypothetical protein [Verrucomicrobiota bacterium]MCH8512141.1 hypothetical protein [Kiritimatiellia bacterium]
MKKSRSSPGTRRPKTLPVLAGGVLLGGALLLLQRGPRPAAPPPPESPGKTAPLPDPRAPSAHTPLSEKHPGEMRAEQRVPQTGTEDRLNAQRSPRLMEPEPFPEVFSRLLETDPDGFNTSAWVVLWTAWRQDDPSAAAHAALELPIEHPFRRPALRGALNAWNQRDPQDALAFYQEFTPEQKNADPHLAALLSDARMESDAETAFHLSMHIPGPLGKSRGLEAMRKWAGTDPDAALRAYAELPDGHDLRRMLAPVMAGILVQSDETMAWRVFALTAPSHQLHPDTLWSTLQANSTEIAGYEEGFRLMFVTWAEREPSEAMAWLVNRQDALAGREEIFKEVYAVWNRSDTASAEKWLHDQPRDFQSYLSQTDMPGK